MKDILKDFLALLSQPILSKIHKFKDAHRGETCYLFGDGISVKWFDLSVFSDKMALGLNYFPFHKDFNKLQVKYLLMTEPWYFYPVRRILWPPYTLLRNRIQCAYREIITLNKEKEFFVNLSNFPVIQGNNVTFLFRRFYDDRLPENFISNRINPFLGSFTTAITLASYLGFRHVYLVGFDYTHEPARSLHWYEKGPGVVTPLSGYHKDFFKIAQEFIDITTVTLDGPSTCLNYVTYEKLTGRKPSFQENTTQTSEHYLRLLSTWPGYKIF